MTNLFPTEAAAANSSPTIAPEFVITAHLDTDRIAGSGSEYAHSGTSNPNSPGQIEIRASGVSHFYTRSNKVLRPQQHGAKTGGDPAINRAALAEMFSLANLTGAEIDMGDANDLYEIDNQIALTWATRPRIGGTGAQIKLNRGGLGSVAYGIRFVVPDLGFDLEGFGVDANYSAAIALSIENTAPAYVEANVKDARLVGVKGSRCYAETTLQNGFGIEVRGWFRELYVNTPMCEEAKRKAGAYDINRALAGFFFGRTSPGGYPIYKEIINPQTGKIWDEDNTAVHNMDAIMIYDAIPANGISRPKGTTSIRGGTLRDAWGRAIKIQACHADVASTMIEFNSGPSSNIVTAAIDFQFGGGNARDIKVMSNGVSPANLVIGQSQTYSSGQTIVEGLQYFATVGTPSPRCIGWYIPEIGGRTDGGLVVRDCHTRVGSVDHIARFSTSAGAAPTERVSAVGNSASINTSGIGFEFFAAEAAAGTIKDNFNLNTNVKPLYTRRDTSGAPVTNTVSVAGATSENWYFSAGT